jgi:uncharacterized protein (TIGR01777 family)
MSRVRYRSRIEAPASEVFAWLARPAAVERLVPPWVPVRVIEREGGIADGGRVVLAIRLGPVRTRWVVRHRDYVEGREFTDHQVVGPFAAWRHGHRVVPEGPEQSILEDDVEYRLPLGPVGAWLGERSVERMLARTFSYQHEQIRHDLARHRAVAPRGPKRIAVTGASGLVGRHLAAFLTTGGHRVDPLVRRAARSGTTEVAWDPARGTIDASRLEGVDAVVHLAGASIAEGRWTPARKAAIRASRVESTRVLAEALSGLARRPAVLVAASAVGYYGDRGDEPLTEASPPGSGFLADVCREWEAATEPAVRAGIGVVILRTGMVLTAAGGALARMLPPFRLGLGGVMGSGRQYVSWIALDDLIGVIHFGLFAGGLAGPVNAVSPRPVTNRELTRTLGRVLRRPTLMAMPGPAVRLLFGELGQALLLEGARVLPARLEAAGFRFRHPLIESALRSELGLAPDDA